MTDRIDMDLLMRANAIHVERIGERRHTASLEELLEGWEAAKEAARAEREGVSDGS